MAEIKIPYSKGYLTAVVPDEKLNAVLESKAHDFKPEAGESELVQQALENPIDSPRLSELAVGKQNIVIIASDHTRPVPSKVIAPLMLAELRKGNPDANITINGYASPEGTEEYNKELSQRRADAVKNILVNKYGIAATRIHAIGHGVGEIFSEPAWNRVGICTIDETN